MALIIKSYLIRQYSIILGILIMPEVMMMQNKDGSHYIKFLINGDDWRTSKCFDQLEKCKEIFDKLWFAISSNKSINIREEKN